MRSAVIAALDRRRMTPRALINDALMRFERAIQQEAPDGIRPALLFTERDHIVRELRGFIDGRVAARLAALSGRDIVSAGHRAAPFDAIVRNRFGECYAVVLRRLPSDGRRLDQLQRIGHATQRYTKIPLRGVLVYDFASGSARLIRENIARARRRSVA